jgi:hypothetical protein
VISATPMRWFLACWLLSLAAHFYSCGRSGEFFDPSSICCLARAGWVYGNVPEPACHAEPSGTNAG